MSERTPNEKLRDGVDIPVLIAGGGPVGLSLAIELGRRGTRCLLVERRDGSLLVPRMSQVSSRNMEFCRRWGIAEKVQGAVWSSGHSLDFVYMSTLTGAELARQKVPSYTARGDLGFTPVGACHCPQIYFDPILAAHAVALPLVTLRYNIGLEDFAQDSDRVSARLVDALTGRTETMTARYLVGCDGPGGTVRDILGIPLGGLGVVADSVNILFRSPALATLHDKGWARFYRAIDETGCWGELIAIDGRELWRLTVFEEKDDEVDAPAHLRRAVGRDFPHEILSVSRWERRDYVAGRYGDGRVFIAGDAAHQCSPTGGLGMHTGVEEAVNLAWKLTAMLDGWGGPGLLPSYEAERRPIAQRNVALATRAYRNIVGISGIPARAPVAANGGDGARPDPVLQSRLGRFSLPEHAKSQYCYENSPICIPDGSPPPADLSERYQPSARPGTRAPHGWVAEGRSTIDLFGDGFVLLRLGPDAPDAAAVVAAAALRQVPLRVESLDDPTIAAIYRHKLVLVRPDGHVAWRADELPPDAVELIDRVRGAA